MKRVIAVSVLGVVSPLLMATANAGAVPFSIAVVVGANQSPSAELEPLRYGDDDAVQNARALALLGVRAVLLVTPDEETRTLFGDVHAAGPARRSEVAAAVRKAFAEIEQAHRRGEETAFYLVYAGHGDVQGKRPYLQLEDGRLWREDVLTFLRESPADTNHLFLDACYSSLFVGDRGPGGEREPIAPGFTRALPDGLPGRTGVIASRSAGGLTHEWEQLQAGIFSYELRSGLQGGADADLDGSITYRELAAFINRANAAIPNAKYRPAVAVSPPGGKVDSVVARIPARSAQLEIPGTMAGRYFVETALGVRVADLHTSPGQVGRLLVPIEGGVLFVQAVGSGKEYRIRPSSRRVVLSEVGAEALHARPRGAAHEAFQRLFALPFGTREVEAFSLGPDMTLGAAPFEVQVSRPRTGAWVTLAIGAAAAVAGVATLVSAHSLSDRAAGTATGVDRQWLNQSIDRRNQVGGLLSGAGMATVALSWWRISF